MLAKHIDACRVQVVMLEQDAADLKELLKQVTTDHVDGSLNLNAFNELRWVLERLSGLPEPRRRVGSGG